MNNSTKLLKAVCPVFIFSHSLAVGRKHHQQNMHYLYTKNALAVARLPGEQNHNIYIPLFINDLECPGRTMAYPMRCYS